MAAEKLQVFQAKDTNGHFQLPMLTKGHLQRHMCAVCCKQNTHLGFLTLFHCNNMTR